jgi:segregation and condensation protein A
MNEAELLDPPPLETPPASVIKVRGELLTELPQDLYIPPDALEIFLEAFEGRSTCCSTQR